MILLTKVRLLPMGFIKKHLVKKIHIYTSVHTNTPGLVIITTGVVITTTG